MTFASPVPDLDPKLERRDTFFTLYDPNGGDKLFSDDGTIRTISNESISALEDDSYTKDSIEEHKDMDELVRRYAPVFKLSYVLYPLLCVLYDQPPSLVPDQSLMVDLKRNGSLVPSTSCWPSMIMYVFLPVYWTQLIEGGNLGWQAGDSCELFLSFDYQS